MRKLLSLAFAILLSSSLLTTSVSANPSIIDKIKNPYATKYSVLAEELLPTVVSVRVNYMFYDEEEERYRFRNHYGSGVFISESGHILTCAHLFKEGEEYQFIEIMLLNGDLMTAEALHISRDKDLALLKLYFDIKTPYVKISNRNPQIGEEVVAIGHPFGLMWTLTNGIITGLNRGRGNQDLIQVNAVINPGNSGGPLFDIKGNLIGINVSLLSPAFVRGFTGQGFAVSTAEIRTFLGKFKDLPR